VSLYLNILTISPYKKFISFFPILFVFLSNPIFAEQLLDKSEILRKSNECFRDFQYKVCNNLFLEMEKIQLVASDQNRYKCQASILGLQTELIEFYYFKKKLKNNKKAIMISYVIKNC
tara:strand:+ start:272 stop:625 length:354 start_codon:yes stop_codon:yes gene_type:complete